MPSVEAAKIIDLVAEDVSAHMQYGDNQFLAAHVVDKNNRTDARHCSCCCTVKPRGWIQIDLRDVYVLDHVIIKGRSDSECYFKD